MIPIISESNNNNNKIQRMPSEFVEFADYDKFFAFNDSSDIQYSTGDEIFDTSENDDSLNLTPPPVDASGCYSLPGYTYPTQQYQYYDQSLNYESQQHQITNDSYPSSQPSQTVPTSSPAPTQTQAGAKPRKGKGGRKKNLYPPTQSVMKHRRNMANARERRRMNGLNDAFERLREVVPNVNSEQKMSKIETLLVAQTYIKALAKLMADDNEQNAENKN